MLNILKTRLDLKADVVSDLLRKETGGWFYLLPGSVVTTHTRGIHTVK